MPINNPAAYMNQRIYDSQRGPQAANQPSAIVGGLQRNTPLQSNQYGLMNNRAAARGGRGGMARYFAQPTSPTPAPAYIPNTGMNGLTQPTAPTGPSPSVPPQEIINLWNQTRLPREAPPPLPPRIKPIARVDDSEAWRATYGREKETAGNQARRGLDALMELQGARGILGGGLGIGEIGANVIGPALNQLGDVNRQLAEQSYAAEVDRQKTNYQGGINQRSQDISHHGNVYSGNISQRGQDYNLLPIIRALYNVSY